MRLRPLLILSLLLAGCASTIPVDALYKPGPGPHPVRVDDSVTLALGPEGRRAAVRVAYPEARPGAEGPWPVVIFSHGMFASNQRYMPMLERWASHGYVVVAPNHPDANGGFRVRRDEDVEGLVVTRADELTAVMDALPEVARRIPGLDGRLRPPPYGAAGHSVGTYTAMLQAGLAMRNPRSGVVTRHREDRIGAVVMSSDPGKMALMPEDLWRGIDVPTFMITGDEDYGTAGKGNRPAPYTAEVLTGAAAPDAGPASGSVHRYRVLVQGLDHYFGGLVHRDPGDVKPDSEGLELFESLSTAFLDAYLKGDARARRYLQTVDLPALTNGRASLDR